LAPTLFLKPQHHAIPTPPVIKPQHSAFGHPERDVPSQNRSIVPQVILSEAKDL
jgi:hypothetical protein